MAFLTLLMTFNLTSCSSNSQKDNITLGTVAGAVVGGGAGSLIGQGVGKAVAVGVGIVGGALIGGYIGDHMDSSDNARMNTAMNNTTYKSTSWTNKKTGYSYSTRPTSETRSMYGYKTCRQFETTANIDGKAQTVTGTACRQPDGTWATIKGA